MRQTKNLPAKLWLVIASLSGAVLLGWIGHRSNQPYYFKYQVTLSNHPNKKIVFNIPYECEVGASGSAHQQEFFELKFAQPSPFQKMLAGLFGQSGLPETISSDQVIVWVDDFPERFSYKQIKSLHSRAFVAKLIQKGNPTVRVTSHYTQEEYSDRIIITDQFEYKEFNGVPFLKSIYQVYGKQANGMYYRLFDTDFCLPKEKGTRFDKTLHTMLRTTHETPEFERSNP